MGWIEYPKVISIPGQNKKFLTPEGHFGSFSEIRGTSSNIAKTHLKWSDFTRGIICTMNKDTKTMGSRKGHLRSFFEIRGTVQTDVLVQI